MFSNSDRLQSVTVKAKSLNPCERVTSLNLLKSADVYQQIFIKYPRCGTFHSYAELLHAALLESDPEVETFIPQPFQFIVGSKPYIPDCYIVKNGLRVVREVRSQSKFPSHWKEALQNFLAKHKMSFEVISNDEIYAREIEALNWLQITQTIVSGAGHDTSRMEDEICFDIARSGSAPLLEIIPEASSTSQFTKLLALYRLLHQGRVSANLSADMMTYSTEVQYVAVVAQ